MVDSGAVIALGAVLILTVGGVAGWRSLQRSRRLVQRLQQQIAALEAELAGRPSARVAFEFNSATREALLHVANDGLDAVWSAPMSIEGPLASQLASDIGASWQDGEATARIRRGQTHTLRLAQLDLSVFPYAQWRVFAVDQTEAGRRVDALALHTSTIGGDPETHAPILFLQVALVSVPESAGASPHCTIALRPFEAVRLRGL